MEQEKFDQKIEYLKQGVKRENLVALDCLCRIYIDELKAEDIDESEIPQWELAEDMGEETYEGGKKLQWIEEYYAHEKKKTKYELKKLVKAGDVESMYKLGSAYNCSRFFSNERLAKKYFRQAAMAGHVEAQFVLAKMLLISFFANTEWLHWLCCANVQGNRYSEYFINDLIKEGGDRAREVIDKCIEHIKTNGVDSIFVPETPEEERFVAKTLKHPNLVVYFFQYLRDKSKQKKKKPFDSDDNE